MENDFFVDIESEAFDKGKRDGIADAACEISNDCQYLGKLKGYKYGLVLGIIQESCESFIESNNNSSIPSKKLEAYRQILDLTRNIPLKVIKITLKKNININILYKFIY